MKKASERVSQYLHMSNSRKRSRQGNAEGAALSSSSNPSSSSSSTSNALVLVGTYHSVVAGFSLKSNALAVKFSARHHVGCVHSIAVCSKYVATAGSDERVFLFTTKRNGDSVADLGSFSPASEVCALAFPDPQHLLCGCVDGTLTAIKTRTWEPVMTLGAHTKRITGIAVHPSGTLTLSIGEDNYIAAVDTLRGRIVTHVKLPPANDGQAKPKSRVLSASSHYPRSISLSPACASCGDSKLFFVATSRAVYLYETAAMKLCQTLTLPDSAAFAREVCATTFVVVNDLLFVLAGCEDGKLFAEWISGAENLSATSVMHSVETVVPPQGAASEGETPAPDDCSGRVRCLSAVGSSVITCGTDGNIRVWRASVDSCDGTSVLNLTLSIASQCGGRITCLSVVPK